jgi:hypothetical protein
MARSRFALHGFGLFCVGIAISSLSASYARSTIVYRSEAEARQGIESACTENTANVRLCLTAYLDYKCRVYGTFFAGLSDRTLGCIHASERLVELLDIEQYSPTEGWEENSSDPRTQRGLHLQQVLFTTKLRRLFVAPSTKNIYDEIAARFSAAFRFSEPASLWEIVVRNHESNADAALEFMAVGLQDVSVDIAFLRYLGQIYEKEGISENSPEAKNFSAARESISLLNANRLARNDAPTFALYPDLKGHEKDAHAYAHHFYLSAYLARRLAAEGYSHEAAFFSAFLLNASWEFTKLDVKMGTKNWPFRDPSPFRSGSQEMQARKIYAGYLGALWAVGRGDEAESYAAFEKSFARNPHEKMTSLYETRFKVRR